MYIIVAGGGMVGGQLARRLLEDKHDVVLIDADPEVCNKIYSQTGVVAITGSAKRIDVLKEAGIDKADSCEARTVISAGQAARYVLLILALIVLALWDYKYCFVLCNFCVCALYAVVMAYKMLVVVGAFLRNPSIHVSQDEIAAHLGTVREMVSRAFRELQEAELIAIERHRIEVLDREGLAPP